VNHDLDDASEPADNARLLAELRRVLGSDPPPAGLVERIEGLFGYRNLESALAELMDVSAAEPAGMRGGAAAARLDFELSDGSVALELAPQRDSIDGQVLAGDLTEVALERPGGIVATATVDELGRFTFDHITPGPARLRVVAGAPGTVTTDWFLL